MPPGRLAPSTGAVGGRPLSTDLAAPGVGTPGCRWPRLGSTQSRSRERRRRWRSRRHWQPVVACCASTGSTTGPSSPTAPRPAPASVGSPSGRSGSVPRSPRCTPTTRCSTRSCTRSPTPSSARSTATTPSGGPRPAQIGCSGERCVSSDSPRVPGDWVGRCPAGHEKSRHRAPTRLMSCGECSRRFDPRHLFTWSYRGRPATLPGSYAAQLAALAATRRPQEQLVARPMVGDLVELAAGPWQGLAGEVELVGAVRCQVRVDDELVSVPIETVRVLPASAARRSRSLFTDGEGRSAQAGRAAAVAHRAARAAPGEHAHADRGATTPSARGQWSGERERGPGRPDERRLRASGRRRRGLPRVAAAHRGARPRLRARRWGSHRHRLGGRHRHRPARRRHRRARRRHHDRHLRRVDGRGPPAGRHRRGQRLRPDPGGRAAGAATAGSAPPTPPATCGPSCTSTSAPVAPSSARPP